MSLTDEQIRELSKKMRIPLADVCFKDELPNKLQMNKTYIINLEDSHDSEGNENGGTHWTMLQCNRNGHGTNENIFFDPYGAPPSENIKRVVKANTGKGLPHTKKDIQSLMNNACGFYCLALAHYINASGYRSNDMYHDVATFLDMFDDLNHSVDFKKNEYILKHFFRSDDPKLRVPIDVDNIKSLDSISGEDEKGGIDAFVKTPVEVKYMNK